jgi:CheY-like chemotaxis protein
VKLLLEFEGHSIETAENGKIGLAMIRDHQYDLVFTDLAMPVMQGDEMARKVRELKPDLPIVMVTAHSDSLSARHPPEGVDYILSKPFMLEDLRGAIRAVCPGAKSSTCSC